MSTTGKPIVLGLSPSFGFGDRTGLATQGHVESLKRAGGAIKPIFAQQSIREMVRTRRTPQQVMDDAVNGAKAAGYNGIQGADADHLKTPADVDNTAAVGFCFFTIDPSENVDPHADDYTAQQLIDKRVEVSWASQYLGKSIALDSGATIKFDEQTVNRAAIKYGKAIKHAISLAKHIDAVNRKLGRDYEIELSVDETPQPTTLAEHWIVADQCLRSGMKLVSLAPRYVGDFEKGVDYKGDLTRFEKSLADHAAIAQKLGPYKLSLHSGSDKLSIYRIFARVTKGMFHVKTAGTSYLEGLRVAAHVDPKLFVRIIEFARTRYDKDKATYHVSGTLQNVPAPAPGMDLEAIYLEKWKDVPKGKGFTAPGRQILHCTFGSVLTDATLSREVLDLLRGNQPLYTQILADHFARHLEELKG